MAVPPLQLNSVTYQPGTGGAWSLALAWTATQGSGSSYWVQMQAFSGEDLSTPVGNPVTTPAPGMPVGTWSTQASGATLNAGTVYWIAVRAVTPQTNPSTLGPWSNALPIIYLGPPTLDSASFDGALLTAVWTPPTGTNLIGDYQVAIQNGAGSTLTTLYAGGQGYPAASPSGAMFQRWPLTIPLGLAQPPLTLSLAPVYVDPVTHAISSGPAAQAGFFPTRPILLRTVYSAGTASSGLQYTVVAQNQSYPSAPVFLAAVYADGAPLATGTLHTTIGGDGNPAATLTLPANPPTGAVLTVTLTQTDANGIGTGPVSAPMALLVSVPTVVGAAFASDAVAVTLAYPPGAPAQAAAQVVVHAGSTAGTPVTILGDSGSVPLTPVTGTSYTLTAAAQSGQSVGPPSATVPLLVTSQGLSSASFDGSVVRAKWQAPSTPPTGLAGYLVTVTSGPAPGIPVRSVLVNDTAAALEVPGGGEALSVTIALAGMVALGPPSTPVALVSAVPAIASAATDPVDGTTRVAWGAVTGADHYSVQPYANGAPSGAPILRDTASYTTTLTPGASQGVAVAAIDSSKGVAVTGPYSPVFPLPTLQPVLQAVSFDGAAARVSWTPAAGATGYVVSVLQSASPPYADVFAQLTTGPGATSASVPLAIGGGETGETYTVVVQALVGASEGPPTPEAALFTPGLFVSTANVATAVPYVYPGATLELAASDITLYLPDLGGGTALSGLPVPGGAFTLAANPDPGTSGRYPYTLSIPANSEAWTFGTAAIRAQLQTDYVSFLKAVEAAGAVPWGIVTLQEAISRAMPQTFSETLYYAYGLNAASGTADLRPGMVLRVAFDGYMNVPGSPVPQWVPGYAGGPALDLEVGSYLGGAGWALGFDAFVAQLVAAGALSVQAPPAAVPQQQQAGGADAADLFFPDFVRPFYRLFIPSQLASTNSVGSSFTPASFVLAAAASYTALSNTVPYPATGNAVAYFRGRAVPRLCIHVWVNGIDTVVPVGTTVGNLLDRAGRRPPATSVALGGVSLQRAPGPAVTDPAAPYDAGASRAVRLDWNTLPVYQPSSGLDPTSLPLLHGDRLTFAV